MIAQRCAVCHRPVHMHDAIVYGFWSQFEDDDQVVVHRGRCERRFERDVFGGVFEAS